MVTTSHHPHAWHEVDREVDKLCLHILSTYLRCHPPTIRSISHGLSMPKDDGPGIPNIICNERGRDSCGCGSHRGSEGSGDITANVDIMVGVCPNEE